MNLEEIEKRLLRLEEENASLKEQMSDLLVKAHLFKLEGFPSYNINYPSYNTGYIYNGTATVTNLIPTDSHLILSKSY